MSHEIDDPVARFRRLEGLYQKALEMAEAERRAYLDEACAGDTAMCREVEELLVARSQAGNFLSVPAFDLEAGRPSIQDDIRTSAGFAGHSKSQPIGSAISQYEILQPIGRGGMGEVWLARDTHLDRRVALKLLPVEFVNDPGRIRRFEQEAKAILSLNHPNIITLFDFGMADGGYYIVTEYVDGETLRAGMAGGRRYTAQESIEIILQICSSLDAAHRIGIVHRDIKPENVMLRPDGYVKLLDFGLAKITEAASRDSNSSQFSLTSPGMVIGTTNYMSPEQARGQRVDARSDIFSLGVVLYELLTGRQAFDGDTTSDIIASILRSDPPHLAGLLNDSLPEEAIDPLQMVIERALDKNREKRYQTAGEMAADLKGAIEQLRFRELVMRSVDKVATEPDAEPLTAVSAPQSRFRWPIAAGVLLLLSAVCASLLIWRNYRPGPDPVASPPIQTLAVLPFRFIGVDRNEEYLGDGMTDGLITKLANSGQLTVRPISAVLGYRQRNIGPQEAARELICDAIVTGSLQKAGSKLRVYVQLNRTGESQPIWTEEFEGSDSDLFNLQDSVALRVVRELSLILTPEQKELVSRPITSKPEAYRLYQQARYFQNKRTPESLLRARSGFERAIALDKKLALAHVNLAYCLSALSERGMVPVADAVKEQLAHTELAVNLDDRLAEAHALLGFYKLVYGWDLVEAGARIGRALELDNRLSMARQFHGVYLLARGRTEEAITETKRAVELDPTTIHIRSQLARALYLGRHYEEAIAVSRDILQIDQKFIQAWVWMGQAYSHQGKHVPAITALEKAARLDGGRIETMSALGYAYAVAGKDDAARRIIADFQEHENLQGKHYYLATIQAGLGDRSAALADLDKAYRDREPPMMTRVKLDPKLDLLRNEPEFISLLRRIGLG